MTDLAGVVGFPVAHSKSPLIHNYWMKKYGVDALYVPLRVHPDDICAVLKTLPKTGFKGVNLTVPHKTAALKIVDELSDEARKAGAVNTLVFRTDGTIFGHNTDGAGFLLNLQNVEPDFDIRKSVTTVLGTGGAARGICAALTTAGCKEIRVVYRTFEKAKALQENVGGNIVLIPWAAQEKALNACDVLANATPLGMNGFEALEMDLSALKPSAIVADAVYAPLKTKLLAQAEKRGLKTANGLGMLLNQAVPAFQAWFGIVPEIDDGLKRLVI